MCVHTTAISTTDRLRSRDAAVKSRCQQSSIGSNVAQDKTAVEDALTSPPFSGRMSAAACTFLLGLPLTAVLRAGLGTGDRAVACCLEVLPVVLAFTAGIKAVASDSGSTFVWYSLL